VSQDQSSLTNNVPLPQTVTKVEKIEEEAHSNKEDGSLDSEEGDERNKQVVLNAQLKSLLQSQIWSEEKDQLLLKLGTQYKCDWKKIAKRFNHKKITPHFLKTRYKELTCAPLQRRIKFSHKEDLMIAKYFEKYGSNWAQMAAHFNDRTAIMLKNRYYSFIRKRELLESMINEVKDIEKDNIEVDNLKDQESETYTNSLVVQRSFSQPDPKLKLDSIYLDSKYTCKDDIATTPSNASNEKHPIFGYERIHRNEFTGGMNSIQEEKTSKNTKNVHQRRGMAAIHHSRP